MYVYVYIVPILMRSFPVGRDACLETEVLLATKICFAPNFSDYPRFPRGRSQLEMLVFPIWQLLLIHEILGTFRTLLAHCLHIVGKKLRAVGFTDSLYTKKYKMDYRSNCMLIM